MAVQASTGRTVPLYVLIIFVVLFLASTTGLVLLFVHQEDLKLQATQATELFEKYIGTRLKNSGKLEAYKTMGESAKPKQTAVEALLADRDNLAQLITGSAVSTSKEIQQKIDEIVNSLPSAEANTIKQVAKSDLVGALAQSVKIIQMQANRINELKQQMNNLQQRNDTITKGYRELEQKFEENVRVFRDQLKGLQQLVNSYKVQYTKQLKNIESKVSSELKTQLTQLKKQFQQHLDELNTLIKRNLTLLLTSMKQLGPAELRVGSSVTIDDLTQNPDGQILDIAENVIYIDLGKQHGIKEGLRFAVISPNDKGQVKPPIKAVIEVIDVGDITSECRVVSNVPANPILKGDLILNLIYDRELKLKIFILGEFDLNKDGIIDPAGRQKIAENIIRAGGEVVNQLTPAINFVILGAPGEEPSAPGPGASQKTMKEYKEKLKRYQQYNDLKDQLQALNIPIITPDLFVEYTGYETKLD